MISGREWVHITRLVAPKINSVCAGICCIRNKASCRLINSHTAILHIISPSLSSTSLYLKISLFRQEERAGSNRWSGKGLGPVSRLGERSIDFATLSSDQSAPRVRSLIPSAIHPLPSAIHPLPSTIHLQCNTPPVQYISSAIHLQHNALHLAVRIISEGS